MSQNDIDKRKAWITWYAERFLNSSHREDSQLGQMFRCPCCHCRTLPEHGAFHICPVCFWEDDGQDDPEANVVRGGPNGELSLTSARQNYLQFGACEARFVGHVRAPQPEETDTEYTI